MDRNTSMASNCLIYFNMIFKRSNIDVIDIINLRRN